MPVPDQLTTDARVAVLIAEGLEHTLRYKTPFFPYVTLFGIWAQIFCLAFMIFVPELRSALYLGVPMLIVPMILYRFLRRG